MNTFELTDALSPCHASIVHDVMRNMGATAFTLPADITPLVADQKLCGPVMTIEGSLVAEADPHETLLGWTGLLSQAKAGHIWVCQPHNQEIALMGELSAETLQSKGMLGCVIDGGARDTNLLVELRFATWRRFNTPRDIVGRWLPKGVDVDITIGEVVIQAGDFLVADRDGVVRIPRIMVAEVTEKACVAMQTENKVRNAIMQGVDPQQAYLQFRKF
jgi:regulator of RNase E activity RraA